MIWVLDLDFIWNFMGTEFLSLEKIDFCDFFIDNELPLTQNVFF